MSNYDITGWAGGRRPITNNLKAGQLRQMGVPRNASSNIFINNNLGCLGSYNGAYFDHCCYGNDSESSMSKFEKWMVGLGVGGGLMGCILGLFGRGKSEGAGDTSEAQPKTDEFAGLKELYKTDKYTFAKIGDKYICKMGDDEVEGSSIEELHDQIKAKRQEAQQSTTTTPTTPTQQTGQTGETAETLPQLFNDAGMSSLKTKQEVLDKFKKETNADAYKIDTTQDITITQVNDKGNRTSMSGNVKITASQLEKLKSGESVSLGKFHDKDVTATSLDGYLQIKVGDQTYIVGKTDNGSYQGYQFKDGNVEGYSRANWTRNK